MPLRPLVTAILLVAMVACSSAPQFDAKAVAMEWAAYMQRDYVVRPGDRLAVRVDLPTTTPVTQGETTDNTREIVVSPTGTIDLWRLPGPLQVAGKSVGEVRTLVLEAYLRQFNEVRIGIHLAQAAVQSVYVCGEVRNAGAIVYTPGMTLTQAVSAAGSFNYTVKESDIRVLRINPDGTQRAFRVNLDRVLRAEWPDFLLLPGDVVYCQTSTIADLGNLVDLYVRRLLPFSLGGPALGTIN